MRSFELSEYGTLKTAGCIHGRLPVSRTGTCDGEGKDSWEAKMDLATQTKDVVHFVFLIFGVRQQYGCECASYSSGITERTFA